MSYDWEQFKQSGDWVAFNEIGDEIIGTVVAIRTGKDFNGNPCPELILRTDAGEEKTLTAGQVMLKAELAEQAPQVGDKIRIQYSGVGDSKPGKAPAKLFKVAVRAGVGILEPVTVPAAIPADEVPF